MKRYSVPKGFTNITNYSATETKIGAGYGTPPTGFTNITNYSATETSLW